MDLNWLANMCTIILGVSSLALGLDPAHSENITVYHVNPGSYNAAPVNMNTASQAGDAFFDMRSVVLPYECSSNSSRKGSDCTNPEVTATDLVITKLVLTVDKTYGEYGFCNVCVNGSAGISGSCEGQDGQYVCSCSHHGGGGGGGYKCDTFFGKKVCLPDFSGKSHLNQSACAATCRKTSATETAFARDVVDIATAYPPRPPTPCNGSVGKENITVFFGKMGCREGQSDWECWRDNVAKKTGGLWYSTTKNGYCGDGTVPAPANCTWKVAQEIKRVNKTCADNSFYNALETYDASNDKCWSGAACGTGAARNRSQTCWIKCFYNTVLGPDGGIPGGAIAGMPKLDLLAAWEMPFSSTDVTKGGCPPLY